MVAEPFTVRARGSSVVVLDQPGQLTLPNRPRPGEVGNAVRVRPVHVPVDEVVGAAPLADLAGDHRNLLRHPTENSVPAGLLTAGIGFEDVHCGDSWWRRRVPSPLNRPKFSSVLPV